MSFMNFVPFHRALTKGKKRGLPKAVRFIFLELCLEAYGNDGVVDLPRDMNDVDAVRELVGGQRREVAAAVKLLADEEDPMVCFEGSSPNRVARIVNWDGWKLSKGSPKTQDGGRVRSAAAERMARVRAERRQAGDANSSRTCSPNEANTSEQVREQVRTSDANSSRTCSPPLLHLSPIREEENKEGESDARARTAPNAMRTSDANSSPNGPERTGEHPEHTQGLAEAAEPETRLKPEQRYAAAWARGISKATKAPCAPPQGLECEHVNRALLAHAKTLRGDALLTWIETEAERWLTKKPTDRDYGVTPKRWLSWLNSGSPGEPERRSGSFPVAKVVAHPCHQRLRSLKDG